MLVAVTFELLDSCSAFSTTPLGPAQRIGTSPSKEASAVGNWHSDASISFTTSSLRMGKDDDDEDDEPKKKEEPMTLAEIDRLEQESSRRVMARLMLPNRIGEAITSAGWAFVALGFLLQANGYCYMVNPKTHLITIDTLENRSFQQEMRKSMREASGSSTITEEAAAAAAEVSQGAP